MMSFGLSQLLDQLTNMQHTLSLLRAGNACCLPEHVRDFVPMFSEADVGVWYAVNVALTFSLVFGFLPAGMLAQGYVQIGAHPSRCWLQRLFRICHLRLVDIRTPCITARCKS